MIQSRKVSLIEAGVNIASGFVISMLIWQLLVSNIWPHLTPSFAENFQATLIFTVISIARSYAWRRFFNNGLHRVLMEWFRT